MAYRGYKYRLYPNADQRAYFARCFGATRYCYNYCVREYDAACAAGVQLSGFDIAARLREHLQGVKWIADVDYEIKESAPHRFDIALMKFKRHEANRPHEHKKGDRPDISYTTYGDSIKIDFKHDLVQLPKIGIVRARLHRSFSGEIVSATIKRVADGNYYISLTVNVGETAAPKKPHTADGTVGVDVGLRHLATLSTGDFKDMPDTTRTVNRLQFLKERHSRQHPGSRQYNHTARQIARLHRHLASITKDTHHKIAAELCAAYDTICMETLDVQGMRRGQPGARTTGEKAFNLKLNEMALASLVDRIRQKADDTGTNFVAIDRFEPTSKTCHVCGYVRPTLDLKVRKWTCPKCHTRHDRDVNAAINIRRKGIELLQAQPPQPTHTLPPAEGNVKTAKETAAGCDLRTVKRKARYSRPPKAKIAVGSAPPRIFKKPRVVKPIERHGPYKYTPTTVCCDATGKMAYYVNSTTVANLAGTSAPLIDRWAKTSAYIKPKSWQVPKMLNVIEAYRKVAEELRKVEITDCSVCGIVEFAVSTRKLVQLGKVLSDLGYKGKNYTDIYQYVYEDKFDTAMTFLNIILPDVIESECQRYEESVSKVKL